jgi:hypothetical protein
MNGSNKLMAAPRINDHTVGGLYRMTGEPDDCGDAERSSPAEYCSLSECIVTPESARGFDGSSEAIDAVFWPSHIEKKKRRCLSPSNTEWSSASRRGWMELETEASRGVCITSCP